MNRTAKVPIAPESGSIMHHLAIIIILPRRFCSPMCLTPQFRSTRGERTRIVPHRCEFRGFLGRVGCIILGGGVGNVGRGGDILLRRKLHETRMRIPAEEAHSCAGKQRISNMTGNDTAYPRTTARAGAGFRVLLASACCPLAYTQQTLNASATPGYSPLRKWARRTTFSREKRSPA